MSSVCLNVPPNLPPAPRLTITELPLDLFDKSLILNVEEGQLRRVSEVNRFFHTIFIKIFARRQKTEIMRLIAKMRQKAFKLESPEQQRLEQLENYEWPEVKWHSDIRWVRIQMVEELALLFFRSSPPTQTKWKPLAHQHPILKEVLAKAAVLSQSNYANLFLQDEDLPQVISEPDYIAIFGSGCIEQLCEARLLRTAERFSSREYRYMYGCYAFRDRIQALISDRLFDAALTVAKSCSTTYHQISAYEYIKKGFKKMGYTCQMSFVVKNMLAQKSDFLCQVKQLFKHSTDLECTRPPWFCRSFFGTGSSSGSKFA